MSVLFQFPLRAQNLTVSPTNLSFAAQSFNSISSYRKVLVSNLGATPITIGSFSASGDFVIGGSSAGTTCVSPLQPNSACNIAVEFVPHSLGNILGALTIKDSDGTSPQVVNLSGTGVPPVVFAPPDGLTFDAIAPGATSASKPVLVTNNRNTPLNIASIATSGGFSQTNNCGAQLAAFTTCTIQVNFRPGAAGAVAGALSITDDASGSPHAVALSGSATGTLTPPLTFSASSLNFGNQVILTSGLVQSLIVTNSSNRSIKISGTNTTGSFSKTDSCTGATLAPKAECTVSVTFKPHALGIASGAATIVTNDPTSPQAVALAGRGIPPAQLSTDEIVFGGLRSGTVSSTQTVTFTNKQATPLTISSIAASTGYQQTNNCPPQLGALASCKINVTFAPTRVGHLDGSITVTDDAFGSPRILNLSGIGVNTHTNPTILENAKPGYSGWYADKLAENEEIEGYASLTSVNRGGIINFYVHTIEPRFNMQIFRMGWYGGAGARLMQTVTGLPGVQQPMPTPDPATGFLECNWSTSYTLQVPNNPADPTDWASGVYTVKLTAPLSGKESYIVFVVRDDSRVSDLLFQCSATTYQAYNDWHDYSLYTAPASFAPKRAYQVSFNRPYRRNWGLSNFLYWEINTIYFLEREGYDVTYQTDIDTHEHGNLLRSHKAFLSVGHDEYWTWTMRDNVEGARDQGVNLAFLTPNVSYWQIRLQPSLITGAADRTIVCYKLASADPYNTDGVPNHQHLVTVNFAVPPVNRSEVTMVGVKYVSKTYASGAFDMVVSNASNWVFANTGLRNGDHLTGLLGYEDDGLLPNSPPGTIGLTHSPYILAGATLFSDMSVYTANSGATVVGTGTMQWAWGIDSFATSHPAFTNPAAQQATRNILARFGAVTPW